MTTITTKKVKKQVGIEKDKFLIKTILRLSISASLAGLGIVLSAIVVLFPNIEFISVTIFLISLLFGVYYGILAATSMTIVYEFLVTSIYGSAGLLIFFKLFCYIILAIIIGLGRNAFAKLSFWELGIIGGFFAIFYDIITTIGGQVVVLQNNITFAYLLTILVWGIPFTVLHFVGNFILFSMTKSFLNWIKAAFEYKGIKLLLVSPLLNVEKEESRPNRSNDK
jgi:hypothetical protein